METAGQKRRRLLNCLDELVRQELACLQRNDTWGLAELQERSTPVIMFLAESGGAGVDEAVRDRIAAVLAHRRETAAFFARQADALRQQLAELETVRHRMVRLLPAYREGVSAAGGRFAGVG